MRCHRHCQILALLLVTGCSDDAGTGPRKAPEPARPGEPGAAPVVETRPRVEKPADLLLRAVPKDALFCVHFPDLEGAWNHLAGTVFGALVGGVDLVDVSLRMGPKYEHLREMLQEPGQPGLPPWSVVDPVVQSLSGEVMLALLDLRGFDKDRPDIRALLGVTVAGAGLPARKVVDALVGVLGMRPGVVIKNLGGVWVIRSNAVPYAFEVGVDRDVVLFGVGAGTVKPALERLAVDTAEYEMSSARCFHETDLARFHVNVAGVLDHYADDLPRPVEQAIDSMRINRVRSLSGAVSIEKQDFAVSIFYDSPGGHDLLTRYFAANTVDYSLLEQLPPELSSFTLMSFNPSWILRNLIIGLPPIQAAALRTALENLRGNGIDLRAETLAALGPQAAHIGLVQSGLSQVGAEAVIGSISHSAWLIQVNDAKVVTSLLDRLSEVIPARRRYRIGRAEAVTYNLGMTQLPGTDFEPSFALTKHHLYAALSEFALRRALETGTPHSAKKHRERLADVPASVSAVSWDSMKASSVFRAGVLGALAAAPDPQDPMVKKLKLLSGALSNLTPAISYTQADETGVFSHTQSPTGGLSGIGGITGLAIVSSIAIPNLMKARSAANESAAIATLCSIRSAQERFRADNLRDRDYDEHGEYGYLADLMEPPRGDPLVPKFPGADGRYLRNGYIFRVFLPGRDGQPVGETRLLSDDVDANLAEKFMMVMAWPVDKGRTGRRTFVVNTNGEIFFCSDGYGGRHAPDPDILSFEPGNMVSRTLHDGDMARDGQHWYRLR